MKRFAFLPFLALVLFTGCSFSVSTANISDVKMCPKLNESTCDDDQTTFLSSDTEVIFVSAVLQNAPEETKTDFTWQYMDKDGPIEIGKIAIETKETSNDIYSYYEKPDDGWVPGDYEVVLKIQTDNADPITKKFTITE